MYNRLPFLVRFGEERKNDTFFAGEYSEQKDLHMKYVKGHRIPLILAGENLLEMKTITEVKRERED